MEQRVTDSLLVERLIAGLSAAFGVLATLLACVGLYGVLAYNVSRRRREIGLRMALGAASADVVRLVLREALLLLAVGLAVGLPVALGLARAVQSQLFGVHFADPLTLGTGRPRPRPGRHPRRLSARAAGQPHRSRHRPALRVARVSIASRHSAQP